MNESLARLPVDWHSSWALLCFLLYEVRFTLIDRASLSALWPNQTTFSFLFIYIYCDLETNNKIVIRIFHVNCMNIFIACCLSPLTVQKHRFSSDHRSHKQRRARLVLGWVTAWEHRVLLATFSFLRPPPPPRPAPRFFFSFSLRPNFFLYSLCLNF